MQQVSIGKTAIELVAGNIAQAGTLAIVTAANASLIGGGGVDGAVHRAAGPELLAAIRRIGRCETGSAVVTDAFNLPAPTRRVIHAVGPRYFTVPPDRAAELLRGAYLAALAICEDEGLPSVAFPSISTGAYGYPLHEAAPIAIAAVLDHLRAHPQTALDLVRFMLYGQAALQAHERALERAVGGGAAS
jgi:O-acetyl-ADP-ribose deacetylase (regulator of RNase III)